MTLPKPPAPAAPPAPAQESWCVQATQLPLWLRRAIGAIVAEAEAVADASAPLPVPAPRSLAPPRRRTTVDLEVGRGAPRVIFRHTPPLDARDRLLAKWHAQDRERRLEDAWREDRDAWWASQE
jgi:hypothetical protein